MLEDVAPAVAPIVGRVSELVGAFLLLWQHCDLFRVVRKKSNHVGGVHSGVKNIWGIKRRS
jgi:hypothetical protein